VLYNDDLQPISVPINIIIVGIIFIHNGRLHLVDMFGINQNIIEPDAIDRIDIVTIGFTTAGNSIDEEHALCKRGLHKVIIKNRIE